MQKNYINKLPLFITLKCSKQLSKMEQEIGILKTNNYSKSKFYDFNTAC